MQDKILLGIEEPLSSFEPTSSTSVAERFLRLFAGLERAHGVTRVTDHVDERGKRKAESSLDKTPVSVELWRSHLVGDVGLGIFPMRDDSQCYFGAIDVDQYEGLDHAAFAKRLAEYDPNLIMCRSKSGGAHIYCFLAEPVEARIVRDALNDAARSLRLPYDVEIFPKSDLMDRGQFSGGWINMPYFGGERPAIRPDGSEMSIQEFLDCAENARVSPSEQLDEESDDTAKKDYERGAVEGNRYNYLKSKLGKYLAENPDADADELVTYADHVIRSKMDPPVPDSEWRKWNVRKLCRRLRGRQDDRAGRGDKPRTRDELILDTADEIRDRFTLAADAVCRVHRYNFEEGRYVDDDHRAFSEILLANYSGNKKRFAIGEADVDKLLLHLNLGDTPQFWPEPPEDQINLANGIYDVDKETLTPHTPDFLYPNQFDVPWIPGAVCPETDKILGQLLDEAEVQFVYEILGYFLFPVTDYHTAVLFQGRGSNGKTTVLDLIRHIVGKRNYSTVTLHQMEGNNFAAHQMVGKLLNIEPDMSERRLPGSAKFKAIVGGDPITVEQKYKDPRTVRLYTRLLMSSNWYPRSADSSPGFFRRWKVLPFDKKDFRDEGPDGNSRKLPREIQAITRAEASGILAKALRAYKRVKKDGFTESARMRAAKDEFKALTDSLSGWLDERTISGPEVKVQQKQLRSAYHAYCESKDYPRLGEKEFSEKVLEYRPEIRTAQLHGERYFIGIGIKFDEQGSGFRGDVSKFEEMETRS